jgi:GH18 family chitinase
VGDLRPELHGQDVKTSGSADKLTAINYAFGNVAPDASGNVVCKLGDEWADYQRPWTADESVTGQEVTWPRPLLGNFQQLQALKEQHPHLEVLISLGGWTWSKYFSDDAVVREYLRRDAPPKRLVVGVPFYSRGWTGVAPTNNGLYQTSTGAAPGTWEAGVEDYKVAKQFLTKGYSRYQDSQAGAAWIMFWELSGDTPNGELVSAIAGGLP